MAFTECKVYILKIYLQVSWYNKIHFNFPPTRCIVSSLSSEYLRGWIKMVCVDAKATWVFVHAQNAHMQTNSYLLGKWYWFINFSLSKRLIKYQKKHTNLTRSTNTQYVCKIRQVSAMTFWSLSLKLVKTIGVFSHWKNAHCFGIITNSDNMC